jgi:hypothetical protein
MKINHKDTQNPTILKFEFEFITQNENFKNNIDKEKLRH